MVCEFLQGLLAPRCAARETFPVPTMMEELQYCLGPGKIRCPYYRRAVAEGRCLRPVVEPVEGLDETLAP